MKLQLLKFASLLLLALCVGGTMNAQESNTAEKLTGVKLIDASTRRIIANASVEVQSNNGIICRKAPCPNNSMTWKGASDAGGVLRIPSYIIKGYTIIKVAGYLKINFKEAKAAADGTPVVELSLDAWHVRFMISHGDEGGRSVWLISRGDIAAGDATNRSDLWRAFPCRAQLSAENLRRMERAVAAVNPSAWRMVYGRSSEYRSHELRLERAGANGDAHHSVIFSRNSKGEMPPDLQALLAATQVSITQTFTGQSCGSSSLLGSP